MADVSDRDALSKDCIVSYNIVQLYKSADIQNVNEAVVVVFHAFMLESGFIPKDLSPDDKYHHMPEKWNAKGVFKIKYKHFCCPSHTCYMTCVPLYSTMCAHGILCDVDCSKSVDIKLKMNNYLKEKKDVSDIHRTFSGVEELSKCFKDDFCLPLLNLLHETIGINRLFGIRGLVDELKIYILKLLPVECVVSMSAVNKDFNHLTNLPYLWKHLYLRDFSKDGIPDHETSSSSNTNWKEMYKKLYKEKKRHRLLEDRRPFTIPSFGMPPIFSVYPDFDTDLDFHFDPPPPEFLPSLQHLPPAIPKYPFYSRPF